MHCIHRSKKYVDIYELLLLDIGLLKEQIRRHQVYLAALDKSTKMKILFKGHCRKEKGSNCFLPVSIDVALYLVCQIRYIGEIQYIEFL